MSVQFPGWPLCVWLVDDASARPRPMWFCFLWGSPSTRGKQFRRHVVQILKEIVKKHWRFFCVHLTNIVQFFLKNLTKRTHLWGKNYITLDSLVFKRNYLWASTYKMHYCLTASIVLNASNEVACGLTFTISTCMKILCKVNKNTLLCRMENWYTSEVYWALKLWHCKFVLKKATTVAIALITWNLVPHKYELEDTENYFSRNTNEG